MVDLLDSLMICSVPQWAEASNAKSNKILSGRIDG